MFWLANKITMGEPFFYNLDSLLFQLLNPNENNSISKMTNHDFSIFLGCLKNYLLSLRESLNFDDFVTFGLELEFEKANLSKIRYDLSQLNLHDFWEVDIDDIIMGVKEVRSPVLTNKRENWFDLHKVTSNIARNGKIGPYSGGHIHIGIQTLGNDVLFWYYFFLVWNAYEHIIFRHCYGEKSRARISIDSARVMKRFFEMAIIYYESYSAKSVEFFMPFINGSRYQAVNFKNVSLEAANSYNFGNTIEFRNPNGTLNPVIWQNNVNLFVHILKYVQSKDFDLERVKWRQQQNRTITLKDYEKVYFEEALEFCDMIFNTNLDKIYFLKQYFKNDEKVYRRIKI